MIKEVEALKTGPSQDAPRISKPGDWKFSPPNLGYSCEVRLREDEAGGYMVYAAQLPGVVSQGEDLESAIRNIAEALGACIETYIQEKMDIPWSEPEPLQANEKSFRIVVNV